jgi:hypothetical protein
MAIDCPDGFMPEFKTRPVYPPHQFVHQSSDSCKTSSNSSSHNKNFIKPLLTILNNNTNNNIKSSSVRSVKQQQQHSNENENNKEIMKDPLCCSFSSIQFIDDDAKSRLNLNDTNTTLTTPLVNKENLLQIELTSADKAANKLSVGKKLFEKQQQKLSKLGIDLSSSPSDNNNNHQTVEFKYGAINSGFEMDIDFSVDETFKKLQQNPKPLTHRAPTPPIRPQNSNFTCFNIIDPGSPTVSAPITTTPMQIPVSIEKPTTETDFKLIQSKSFEVNKSGSAEPLSSPPLKTFEISEIFRHIDEIQGKLDLLKLSQSSVGSASFQTTLLDNHDLNSLNMIKCNDDINKIRNLIKTESFKTTLSLYNRLVKLGAKYDLRPLFISNEKIPHAEYLVDEVI